MLEKLKALWQKLRVYVLLTLASLAFAFMIFRKGVTGELDDLKNEQAAKEAARKKQLEEEERLRKEKEEAQRKAEEQKQKELKEAEERAKARQKELEDLEQEDPTEFKRQLGRELGVKEKRKGRPKKNV